MTSLQVGAPILEALGIDPSNVTAATLRLRAGRVPTLVVKHVVLDCNKERMVSSLRRYTLHENSAGPSSVRDK